MIKHFKIIKIIERACDMNRITAKTVSSHTSYQTKLIVDLILEGIVQKEKLLKDITNMFSRVY